MCFDEAILYFGNNIEERTTPGNFLNKRVGIFGKPVHIMTSATRKCPSLIETFLLLGPILRLLHHLENLEDEPPPMIYTTGETMTTTQGKSACA